MNCLNSTVTTNVRILLNITVNPAVKQFRTTYYNILFILTVGFCNLYRIDLDDYRLFTIRWLFLPSSGIVFLWNIVEAYLIYEDKPSDTDVFWITYTFVSHSLMAMFVYMSVLILLVMDEKELHIDEHRSLMILYHIFDMFVDLTLLIAACSYTPVDPGLKSRFAVFIYSICDIILSFSQFVKIAISIWISRSVSVHPNN